MIKIVKGDLLEATEDVIIHQTNCQGVMGGGVAYQIKVKYPEIDKEYKELCNEIESSRLLGTIQILDLQEDGKSICNLFGQNSFGIGLQTNYEALESGLEEIKRIVKNKNNKFFNKTLAMPYNIGCGLGGGDWNVVFEIIEKVFNDGENPYDVTLYQRDE